MALPPWMRIVYGNRVDPTRGISVNTFRQDTNSTPLGSRGARRRRRGREGSSGSSSSPDERATPAGVVERLRDLGLSERQIERATADDKGDEFSVTSPGDWLGALGGGLKRGLDALDVPRAYVMSGLVEASDAIGGALDAIPGVEYEPPKQTDRLRQGGVSWRDFVTNAQNHVGFADVLDASPGSEDLNPWVKAGAGFAFDVASDPLNYIGVGLADEPAKIARAFADDSVARALAKGGSLDVGRTAAKEAAAKVLQKGVTALDAEELAAIGRKGGLYARTPGTGVVGRTLRADKAIEALRGGKPLERTITLAERGTRLGDVASEAAQIARKPLNAVLRATAPLAERGLSGTLPGLRAAVRRSDDADEVVGALWTVTKEAEARHVKRAFEDGLVKQLGPKLRQAQADGVDGRQLWLALTGDKAATAVVGRSTVDEFRTFLDEARDLANTRAGRKFVMGRKDYAPRILTEEALEAFGLARQADGNVRSIAKGRTYGFEPGMKNVLLGERLHDPASAMGAGRSVEQQIEDILVAKGKTPWFNTDAYSVLPEYVNRLGRQMQTEYLGTELKKVGVGRELYRPNAKGAGMAATPKARIREWRRAGVDPMLVDLYKNGLLHPTSVTALDGHLRELSKIAEEAEQSIYKPVKWERVIQSAKAGGIDVKMRPVLEGGWKQYGGMTGMPANIVDNLRDIGKMSDPGALGRVAAIHDRLLKGWRQMALLSPGYHWRNTFGGVYMNWLGDVDEGRYKQIAQLLLHERRGTLATAKIDPDLKAAFEEAKRLGVFSGGQSVNDITLGAPGRLSGVNPFRRSQAVGGAVENELRGAMFIDEFLKNGGDGTEAFSKVQKYHFDYENLGTAERKIRQAVPFYTWTRRSVPLMLEMMVRNPSKINRYFRAKESVERLSEEEGILPQYFEDNWAIRLPWEGKRGQRYIMPDLPLMSLVDVTDTGQLGGQLSPFIKTFYEYNAGKQLWKGIPLKDDATPIPTPIAIIPGLVPALRATGHIHEGPDGKPVMTNRDVYLLQQFLPQLGQTRRLFPQEDKYSDRRMTSWLSYLFGIGARTNTQDDQANELWNRYFDEADQQQQYEDLGYEKDEAQVKAFGPR